MKKILTSKFVILLAVAIALVVFNALVFNVSIVRRNVVVGIGLDYEDGKYTLLTQVVLSKNGGVTSGGNNYVTLKAEAQNIDIAIDKIEKVQGTVLSFAQAAIMILGKNMMENGDLEYIETFFMDDRVHDNMQIVMAEDKAEDVLNAQVAAGEVASLQLVSQLRPTKTPLEVAAISLQEYVRNSKNEHKINYMPVVSVEETQPSTDQSKENEDKADKLIITKTAITNENGFQFVLDDNMTQSFNLAKNNMQDGVLKVDGEEMFSVHIVESKSGAKYDWDKKQCEIQIKLKTIRSIGRHEGGKISFKLSEEEVARLIKSIDTRIKELYQFGLDRGIDILNVADGFRKKYPRNTAQILSENFMKEVEIKTNIKIYQVN